MKSSLTWMQDYVDVDMNQDMQAFADKLTIAGIPVEQVEYWGTEVKKVKTGKILQIDKHPDADKPLLEDFPCLNGTQMHPVNFAEQKETANWNR